MSCCSLPLQEDRTLQDLYVLLQFPGHLDYLSLFLVTAGSIREENGVRWHVCPYCTKEFRKPSDLVRHIRIHTHEKPFKCPQCFRAFAVKSTLTAHIKTHTGIKAFKCQYCMKSFSTSGSLKVHIRLHTGVHMLVGVQEVQWQNSPGSFFPPPLLLICDLDPHGNKDMVGEASEK